MQHEPRKMGSEFEGSFDGIDSLVPPGFLRRQLPSLHNVPREGTLSPVWDSRLCGRHLVAGFISGRGSIHRPAVATA